MYHTSPTTYAPLSIITYSAIVNYGRLSPFTTPNKEEKTMLKNIIFLFLPIFLGCATPQGKLITTLDYLSNNKQAENSGAILDHKFNLVRNWSYVLNGKHAGEVYPGFSFTSTSPDNFFSFKLMFTTSGDYVESTEIESVNTPEKIQIFIPIGTIAEIETVHKVKNFIVMPSVTVPILHYKSKFGFGSEPNIKSSIELRTGMAYDFYIHYKHSEYYISFLDGQNKKISLPSDVSDNGYFSHMTSVNFDLAPFHFETNLILNTNEIKTALGIGLVW